MTVAPLEGELITIQGRNLQFADHIVCSISDPEYKQWTNDRLTFGSFGGDWSDVGLTPSADQRFHVVQYEVACPHLLQTHLSIVTQREHGTVLIGAFRVFVRLLPAD